MNILVTAPYPDHELSVLRRWGDVQYDPWIMREKPYSTEEMADVLGRVGASVVVTELDPIDRDVLTKVHLDIIGVCRGTPVNVDVPWATQEGIPVFRTPGRNAEAVAELVLCLTIAALRRILPANQWVREGFWGHSSEQSYAVFRGSELWGKRIGLVGFGSVGQALARLLTPFDCEVRYYDPYVRVTDERLGNVCSTSDLATLFRTSDIISNHLPDIPATDKIISADLIAEMPRHAIFVNTARARTVDRQALGAALTHGTIAGAVLDVFDHEPPSADDLSLCRLPNVVATPHIGGATHEVVNHHAAIMTHVLTEWLEHHRWDVRTLVNPSALERSFQIGKDS